MERKLELRDVAGYLSYGISFSFENGIWKTNNINVNSNLIEVSNWTHHVSLWVDIEKIKPILRPLSDLYRTITHNGKEIIPIVELVKILFPNYEWKQDNEYGFAETVNHGYTFCYDEGYNVFNFDDNYCIDQLTCFDYLHELKIDYRGLIDAGLAIDVNTLKNDPYK
jgi:hypothetical protein